MEGDKRRTREDTWKSDELKKHLTGSLSDNQSDDKRHRERKPRERDGWGAHDYKGSLYKEQGKGRVKSKERTGEKARFKSSERHREERKESGREKDHPREQEREKFKATRDRHGKEEKQSAGRGGERQSGGERERKHRKDDPNHAHMQNTAVIYGERSKEHYRRGGSKDYRDPSKAREEEKERRYSERKNKEAKNHEGEISKYRDEEHEHQRRSHREEELDKDRKRSHKEKREWERSVVEGKEKLLKETLRAYKNGQEGHVPRSRKEPPFHEDRLYKESSERRQKEDGEMKKRDHKPSEHKSQRKSSRHEDETEHLRERSSKEKIKTQARSEKEDTRQEEPVKDIANPANSDADYDNYSVNYEEDFEDYEDDFDDTDDDEDDVEGQGTGEREEEEREAEEKVRKVPVFKNSEIEEIQKAINAENERAQTFLPGQRKNEFLPKEGEKELGMERQDSPRRSPVPGKFIDFQTAKRQQSIRKVASEQKKRSLELLRLIDLDFSVSFCLLDLPPVNEYDMYIRNFGKTNTKQAYVQWNEDNLERDVQTEEIEMQEKWTQHPGETAIVCGGPKKSSSDVSVLAPKIDSQRLASFLRSACQVIAVLLEEDQVATQPRRNLRSRQTSLSISDKCFQLNTNLPFLQGRKVSCLHISQAQRQALLSVHTFPEKPSDLPLDRKNIICVWNVWQPSNPQKILFCGSQVTCCCFSPSKATLVFAGTGDGSVLVWDLREDARMHHCMNFNETDWAFRSPTFSTDGVFTSLSHMCPILTIEPVSTTVFKEQNCGLSYLSSREELLGLSFQIASMDENGILSLWVVVELQKEDLAGSQRDLGLIPGGKVKLVHSSTFQIKCSYLPKDTMCLGTCQPLNIKFLPSNPNHFIVGTDMAVVSHGTRHELKAPPKLFKPQQGGPRSARVNAMDFSPFGKPLFLAGCSDGSIRLHQMTSELPLIQWNASTAGQPIIALQWALTRPAVFFVLDATSVVYVWDLLETDLSPVAKQPTQADKVLTMAVLGEPEKLNGLLGLALAKESGIIEIWYVKKKWAVPQPEESEKLNLLLQQAL